MYGVMADKKWHLIKSQSKLGLEGTEEMFDSKSK